jgi:hypothetical protein
MLSKCNNRQASYPSFAFRVLQAQCRSTVTHARILRGDDLGPTRDDTHQTFRVRKDGKSKELPLPPLLDPVILEKRSKWENTKDEPKAADFTPFQKKLQANAFGV